MGEWPQGTWKLVAWRRVSEDGTTSYPLGKDATGQLIYTPNGVMAVQIAAAGRPELPTGDPLGGEAEARAAAYSTYLAYFGTYEVTAGTIVHHVDQCLFPNWSGDVQTRPFSREDGQLILRTPPMRVADGTTVVNELAWEPSGH